ncbi:molybdenum cofactor biosynthesis protein MoaE [Candidatus Neomarinimicrobiota bacterium]
MIRTRIMDGPLQTADHVLSHTGQDGAKLNFSGVVRGVEQGHGIRGLYYEAYGEMAARELGRLAHATVTKFALTDLLCDHRIGEVPVDEVAIYVTIRSPHRQAALDGMGWFISELKERVPIWKWGISPTGERTPTAAEKSG